MPNILAAQSAPDRKFYIGITGGVILGRINLDLSSFNIPDNDTKPGYNLKLFAGREFGKHLALQTEFTYWQQTAAVNSNRQQFNNFPLPAVPDGAFVTLDTDLKISYIENALLANIHFKKGKVTFFGLAGPFLGRILSATNSGFVRVEADNNIDFVLPYDNQDQRDEFRDWNYGIALGGGISYPLFAGELMLVARGNIGIANIANEENTTYSEVKTYNAAINTGYRFFF